MTGSKLKTTKTGTATAKLIVLTFGERESIVAYLVNVSDSKSLPCCYIMRGRVNNM